MGQEKDTPVGGWGWPERVLQGTDGRRFLARACWAASLLPALAGPAKAQGAALSVPPDLIVVALVGAACAIGFAGALIIIRPGSGVFDPAAFFALGNSASWALAIILIRMQPDEIRSQQGDGWDYQGIVAYSKICTHVGCPIALYEQRTHHLLCPCHQSTFDLADSGKVIFGPAVRRMPQLGITVDSEGYLIARGDFAEPIGPSFWEIAQ